MYEKFSIESFLCEETQFFPCWLITFCNLILCTLNFKIPPYRKMITMQNMTADKSNTPIKIFFPCFRLDDFNNSISLTSFMVVLLRYGTPPGISISDLIVRLKLKLSKGQTD